MNQTLLARKKAVDRALDAQAATHEIPLAAFPGHAAKSLEHILAEDDAERAAARLTRLQAEVHEACTLVKQGGARIRVVRYEEPARAAKPEVETERDASVAKSDAAPAAAADVGLAQAPAALGLQVAVLRQALDTAAPARQSNAAVPATAPGQGDAGQEVAAQQAAAQQTAAQKAGAEKAAAQEAVAQQAGAPGNDNPGKADEPAAKPEEAKPVAKSQAGRAPGGPDWPFDMNTTMPGADLAAIDSELDWGPDPALAQAEGEAPCRTTRMSTRC